MLPRPGYSLCHVLIDPGHGGHDLGTRNFQLTEKDITLTFAFKLRETLSTRGILSSKITRETDTYIKPIERKKQADKENCQLFLSLHINSHSDSRLRGTEIYFGQKSSTPLKTHLTEPDFQEILDSLRIDFFHKKSESLAYRLKNQLKTKWPNRPIKIGTLPLLVLNQSVRPSLLIEIGYLSNPQDLDELQDMTFINTFSQSLAQSLESLLASKEQVMK
jgi:N-acetylmuramoyl-L-alanine amidase